jgi:enterochelin esterase-like enzyme
MLLRLATAIAVLFAANIDALAKDTKTNITSFADNAPPCTSHSDTDVCSVPPPSAQEALAELNGKTFAVVQNGQFLDVVYEHGNDFVFGEAPLLADDIETPMERIGDGLWSKRLVLRDPDHALVTLSPANVIGSPTMTFGGAHADHALVKFGTSSDVKTITTHSNALKAARDIYVYRGERCRTTVDNCRVIYFADGGTISLFMLNKPSGIDTSRLVLVGLANPPHDDQFGGNRIAELLKDSNDPAYARFQKFLIDEIIPKVEGHGQPAARYVGGYSNGGGWAVTTMLAHPNIFGGALAFSPAPQATSQTDIRAHAVWIGSGTLESFRKSAEQYAKTLKGLHADVQTRYFVGGHYFNTWNALFWWAAGSWN